MALRPRNIALEGFAHDFYPPSLIAARGFAVDDEEAEEELGNGSGARARFLYQRPLRPAAPVLRVVSVSARGESPAPTDEADVHVEPLPVHVLDARPVPASRVAICGATPTAGDTVRIAAAVAVSARGETPMPLDVGRLAAPCVVKVVGETPMPCDVAAAIMYRPRDPSLLAFRERTPDGRRDFRADFISARSGRSLLPRERQSFAMGPSCLR